MSNRFITLWRRPDSPIDWEFHVSETEREASEVLGNLTKRGVKKATTYRLGEAMPSLSVSPATSS